MPNEVVIVVKARKEFKPVFDEVRAEARKLGDDMGKEISDRSASSLKQRTASNPGFGQAGDKIGDVLGEHVSARLNETISDRIATIPDQVEARMRDSRGRFTSGGGGGKTPATPNGKSFGLGDLGSGLKDALGLSISDGFKIGGMEGNKFLMRSMVQLAPYMGALLSGAISGAVGTGGLLGGVMLATRDPRVKDAGKNLGRNLLSGLTQDAKPFIDPVLRNIDMIGTRFEGLRPKLRSIFADSSKFVDPMAQGLMKGVEGFVDGIARAMGNVGPVMGQLGKTVGQLGTDVGDFLADVSTSAPSAAKGIADLTSQIGFLLDILAPVINGLSTAYEWMDKLRLTDMLGGPLGQVKMIAEDMGLFGDKTKEAGEAAGSAAPPVSDLATATFQAGLRAGSTGYAILTLTERINDLAKGARDAYDAETQVGEALDNITAGLKKNGHTMDSNTEKGRANRENLSALRDALLAQYNATVTLNGEGEKANEVMRNGRAAFVKAADAMGISKREANRLADAMGLIKAPKPIRIDTNAPAVQRTVRNLQAEINRMHGRTIPITVRVTRTGETLYGNQAAQNAAGGITGHAAEGGPRSGLTWVGEHGPELIDVPAGARVWSSGDSKRMETGKKATADAIMRKKITDSFMQFRDNPPPVIVTNVYLDMEKIATALTKEQRKNTRSRFQGFPENTFGTVY